jgi:GntR family transcriptional regulator
MQIHITSNDGVPIYLQIVQQVKHLVASGRLAAGDEIPPIRGLAEQLVVNPNTVARAYLELERAGIVTKRHGAGTYIAEPARVMAQRDRLKILRLRIDPLVTEARHLGVEVEDLIKLVRERDAVLGREKTK